MCREVLHFCLKINFRLVVDANVAPFRLNMEVCVETFHCILVFLGVLCCMLLFFRCIFYFEALQVLLFGDPDPIRETTSPAKDRMVETKNEKSRKR